MGHVLNGDLPFHGACFEWRFAIPWSMFWTEICHSMGHVFPTKCIKTVQNW
jgi:hypothetical protein